MKNATLRFRLLYSIITITSLYISLLHTMDQPHISFKNNQEIVFELILDHGSIFSHNLICALALVNKYSNRYIKNTAFIRKNLLEMRWDDHKNQTQLVWHIHGSAYAYVNFLPEKNCLRINYNYLSTQNCISCMVEKWTNDPRLLLNEPKIFFNQKGDACYYASGILFVPGYGTRREIIEYSVSRKYEKKQIRCVLGTINNKKEFQSFSLAHIARNSFPDLTRAILNSQNTYELSSPWHRDTIKVFDWNGVKVPQEYLDSRGKTHINFNTLSGKIYSNEHVAKN